MSRWTSPSDQDYHDDLNGPDDRLTNATCADCGTDYARADHDVSTLCDGCSDRRDAHTSALEIRVMAKAILRSDVTRVKDVA